MQNIDYYLSTSVACARDLTDTIAKVTGLDVYFNDGTIIFPPDFAKGKVKYYELAEGLSVLLVDCVFYEPLKFTRAAVKSNDYHLLQFNLTAAPVVVNSASGETIDIGSDWKDAVFYSSTGKGAEFVFPVGRAVRMVVIIANQHWFGRNFRLDAAPFPGNKLEFFSKGGALQFTTNLTLKCMPIAEEMLSASLTESVMPVYLKGSVLRLIAQFNVTLMTNKPEYECIAFETAVRIMRLKEKLEFDLSNWKKMGKPAPFMTTAEAAHCCFVSKTTFCRLFLDIYGVKFKTYFDEKRIHIAAEMLRSGIKPTTTALRIGYRSMGGFIKEFKLFYHTTPARYQADHRPRSR